jgi:hypothetical protein
VERNISFHSFFILSNNHIHQLQYQTLIPHPAILT